MCGSLQQLLAWGHEGLNSQNMTDTMKSIFAGVGSDAASWSIHTRRCLVCCGNVAPNK